MEARYVEARQLIAQHARRLGLFVAVGLSGVVINTAVLWALVSHAQLHHVLAAIISTEVSILTNFVLNDRFTFGDHQTSFSYLRRAAHYNAVTASGLVITVVVLTVLTYFGMYYLLANFFAMGSAALSNYVLHSRFTWPSALSVASPKAAELSA